MGRTGGRARRFATAALALGLGFGLVACTGSPIDNIIEGAVGDEVREALGGDVDIATDGRTPAGFPEAAVPLVGEVQGGASAGGAGWTVLTTVPSMDSFAEAVAALEGAAFVAEAQDVDENSGYAAFSSAEYDVKLTYSTTGDTVTATYIVTPGG